MSAGEPARVPSSKPPSSMRVDEPPSRHTSRSRIEKQLCQRLVDQPVKARIVPQLAVSSQTHDMAVSTTPTMAVRHITDKIDTCSDSVFTAGAPDDRMSGGSTEADLFSPEFGAGAWHRGRFHNQG